MVAKVLKPNVQDLQKDVVELLEKISKLMYQASSVLVADGVENKYTQYQQQISNEAVIGTTLELATLPTEARPSKPAQSALALCRAQIDTISRTTDAREFITAVVEETANNCIAMINNYSKKI